MAPYTTPDLIQCEIIKPETVRAIRQFHLDIALQEGEIAKNEAAEQAMQEWHKHAEKIVDHILERIYP